jgi:aminoglycoside phosphotransferase (APT) family kinase protein
MPEPQSYSYKLPAAEAFVPPALLSQIEVRDFVETQLQLGAVVQVKDSSKGCDQRVWLVATATTTVVVKQPKSEHVKVYNENYACSVAASLGIPAPRTIHLRGDVLVQTMVLGHQVAPGECSTRPCSVYVALGQHLRQLHAASAPYFGELGKTEFANLADKHKEQHQNALDVFIDMPSLMLSPVERVATRAYYVQARRRFLANNVRPPVLLHGDIADDNFISDDALGSVSGVIDWADISGGVPEEEFGVALAAGMHPAHYDAMVSGYGRAVLVQEQVEYFAVLRLTWILQGALKKAVRKGDSWSMSTPTRDKLGTFRRCVGLQALARA